MRLARKKENSTQNRNSRAHSICYTLVPKCITHSDNHLCVLLLSGKLQVIPHSRWRNSFFAKNCNTAELRYFHSEWEACVYLSLECGQYLLICCSKLLVICSVISSWLSTRTWGHFCCWYLWHPTIISICTFTQKNIHSSPTFINIIKSKYSVWGWPLQCHCVCSLVMHFSSLLLRWSQNCWILLALGRAGLSYDCDFKS